MVALKVPLATLLEVGEASRTGNKGLTRAYLALIALNVKRPILPQFPYVRPEVSLTKEYKDVNMLLRRAPRLPARMELLK